MQEPFDHTDRSNQAITCATAVPCRPHPANMIYIVHVMIRDLSARQDLDDEMGIYLIFPMCAPVTTAKMIPLKYEVR